MLSDCFTFRDSELSQIWAYNYSWLVNDGVEVTKARTRQGLLLAVLRVPEGSDLQYRSGYGTHQPYSQDGLQTHQLQDPSWG